MKKLTNKEREIMECFWAKGPMFIREMLEGYEDPKPHFNTLSTLVRILEKKGFVGHRQYGNTYQYYPLFSEQEYGRSHLTGIIKNYFNNSYTNVISTFVKEENISVDDLKEIIAQIEKGDQK